VDVLYNIFFFKKKRYKKNLMIQFKLNLTTTTQQHVILWKKKIIYSKTLNIEKFLLIVI